ncbi:putative Flagellin [Candidatus Terasakiella magnetica]|nr:putative Flagellin [Candidatus Terasakiella magnetica]
MSSVTSLSGSNLPIRVGNELLIGVRPSAPSRYTSSSAPTPLSAGQGAKVVSTALKNSTSIFSALSSLQNVLQKAADPATAPKDKAATAAVNTQIDTLKKQIDALAAGAKVGNSNLLSNDTASVTVKTGSGLKVTVAAQGLDAKSLGLADIKVGDSQSSRSALAKVTQALGQTQVAVYRLQTADGATGIPTTTGTSPQDYISKALANQAVAFSIDYADTTASTTNKAAAAVSTALANQAAANPSSYSISASTQSSYTPGNILNLLV